MHASHSKEQVKIIGDLTKKPAIYQFFMWGNPQPIDLDSLFVQQAAQHPGGFFVNLHTLG